MSDEATVNTTAVGELLDDTVDEITILDGDGDVLIADEVKLSVNGDELVIDAHEGLTTLSGMNDETDEQTTTSFA